MRITLKTTGFTLTEAIAIYLERRMNAVSRLVKNFEGTTKKGHAAVMARVELAKTTRHHKKGDIFRAEVTLDVPGRAPFRAEAEAGDLRSAIDIVREELVEEVRSWKEKRKDSFRRGGRELKRRLRGEPAA